MSWKVDEISLHLLNAFKVHGCPILKPGNEVLLITKNKNGQDKQTVLGDFINFPTHQLLTHQLPTRQLLLYLTISPTITQEIPTRQPLLKLYQLVNLTNSSTRKQNVPTRQP